MLLVTVEEQDSIRRQHFGQGTFLGQYPIHITKVLEMLATDAGDHAMQRAGHFNQRLQLTRVICVPVPALALCVPR